MKTGSLTHTLYMDTQVHTSHSLHQSSVSPLGAQSMESRLHNLKSGFHQGRAVSQQTTVVKPSSILRKRRRFLGRRTVQRKILV